LWEESWAVSPTLPIPKTGKPKNKPENRGKF
jgi:hypothetical protein